MKVCILHIDVRPSVCTPVFERYLSVSGTYFPLFLFCRDGVNGGCFSFYGFSVDSVSVSASLYLYFKTIYMGFHKNPSIFFFAMSRALCFHFLVLPLLFFILLNLVSLFISFMSLFFLLSY